MHYTFLPKEKHAKAFGRNMRISAKKAVILCRVIKKKPLTRAKRLLEDLAGERRSLGGKYYTKTAKEMLLLLNSCEKNADALGLDAGHLMVHASAHQGTNLRRRRRKQNFGIKMKSANVEIFLVEKARHDVVKKEVIKKQMEKKEETVEKEKPKEIQEMQEQTERIREQTEKLEKQVEEIVGKDIPTSADRRKAAAKKQPKNEEKFEEKE